MNCYNHRTISAVGLCRACGKGVCANCAYDTEYGIACHESCEARVRLLGRIVDNNAKVMKTANSQNWTYGVSGIIMGGVFLTVAGWSYMSGSMSMVFLCGGIGLPITLLGLIRLFQRLPVATEEKDS